jgi:hypothetical protein
MGFALKRADFRFARSRFTVAILRSILRVTKRMLVLFRLLLLFLKPQKFAYLVVSSV